MSVQPTEPTNPNDVSEPKVVPQSSESPEADIDLSIDDTSVEAVVEAPVAPESPEPAPVVSESPQPVAPPEIPVKKPKSKKLLAIAILVLVLAVAGALAWLLLGKKDDSSSSTDTAQQEQVARLGVAVTLVDGTAEFSKDNFNWTALTTDTDLVEGDYVRAKESSRVVLTLDDGSAVRIGASSSLGLESLEADNVVIQSEGGELYSRVVASSSRSYTVSVDGSSYKAMGTAFRTIDTTAKSGVEVFHSGVEVDSDVTVTEGSALYKENADATKKGVVSALDINALKSDEFIKWCAEQDKKQSDLADKLGVLTDIDKPAEAPAPAPTPTPGKPAGISLSGSQDSYSAKFSWSVNGVDVSEGYKLLRSKTNSKPGYSDKVAYISSKDTSYSLFVGDGETYYYRLCSYSDGACVSYSNTVQVATTKKEKPVVEAGAVTLSIADSTASWIFAGTAPNGFKLVMSTSPSPVYPTDYKKYVDGTSTSIPSDLDAGTYYVRVCKYTGDGCQDYSNEVTYVKP